MGCEGSGGAGWSMDGHGVPVRCPVHIQARLRFRAVQKPPFAFLQPICIQVWQVVRGWVSRYSDDLDPD